MVLINQFINFKIGGVTVAANSTELNYNAGVVAGVASASKSLVLDASKDVSGINHLSASQLSGVIQTSAQPNITSLGTLGLVHTSGTLLLGDNTGATNGILRAFNFLGSIFLQPGFNNTSGSATHLFITDYFKSTTDSDRIFSIMATGKVGIQSYNPTAQCEINAADGWNLRLTYNDKDGSAANYADLTTNSTGDLFITTSGTTTNIGKKLKVHDAIENFNTGGLQIRSFSGTNNIEGRTIQKSIWTSEFNIVEFNPPGLTDNYAFIVYGYIQPRYSQTYTFYPQADDRVRVWINGTLIYTDWAETTTNEQTAPITVELTANIYYPIYVEFGETAGASFVGLKWSSSSQAKEYIPTSRMAWDDKDPALFHNCSVGNKLTLFNALAQARTAAELSIDGSGNVSFFTSGGNLGINSTPGANTTLDIAHNMQLLREGVGYSATLNYTALRLGVNKNSKNFNIITSYVIDFDTVNGAGTHSKLHFRALGFGDYNGGRTFETSSTAATSVECLTLDNGKVGVGTINPSTTLHIEDANRDNPLCVVSKQVNRTCYVDIINNDNTRCLIGACGPGSIGNVDEAFISNWTGDKFHIVTNATIRATVNQNTFGIGTTSPTSTLHVVGTQADIATFANTEVGNGGFIEVNNQAGTRALLGPDGGGFGAGDVNNVILANWTNGALDLRTNALNRMFISSSGNIGIGTTNPGNKMHIFGTDTLLKLENNVSSGRNTIEFLSDNDTWEFGMRGSTNSVVPNGLYWWNSGYKMVMTQSGNMGLGDNFVNPVHLLHLYQSGNNALAIENTLNTSSANILFRANGVHWELGSIGSASANAPNSLYIHSSGSYRMVIRDSGNMGINTTTPAYKLDVNGDINTNNKYRVGGAEVVPTCTFDVNLTGGSYANTQYYPVLMKRSYLGSHDFSPMISFQMGGVGLGGGDPYNENSIKGFARGGGWTDHTILSEITIRNYDDAEHRFLAIYKGNTSFDDGVVIYVRGGYNYSLTTDATNIIVGTDSAALTEDASVFAIKDNNGADIIGTTSNTSQLQYLALASGRYQNSGRHVVKGNLGVGTDYPNTLMHAYNTSTDGTNAMLTLQSDNCTDNSGVSMDFIKCTSNLITGRINNYRFGNSDYGMIFYNWTTSLTEAMILRGGKMGIRTNNPLSVLHIKQDNQSHTGGFKCERSDNSNYWAFFISAGDGLDFAFNGVIKGYLSSATSVSQIDFTGQHRSSTDNDSINNNIDKYIGLIVSSLGEYNNINGGELNINEALPKVDLATTDNDKRVYGVISNREDENSNRTYEQGSFVSVIDKNEGDERLIINSIGEGMLWICDKNGPMENGDYITSSTASGYGQLQSDDILHNYTVAKITQDCDFSNVERYVDINGEIITENQYNSSGGYKCAFVGCTYHCG